jgi:hypothetical protein
VDQHSDFAGFALRHNTALVEDRRELTQRDRSNLTHPQGYLMAASPVDIS